MTQIVKDKKAVIKFLLSLVAALAITFLLKQPDFNDSQVYVIFLLFFAIGLWLTEAIPAFAVSLFIIAFLVFALGNPHLNAAPENIEPYVNTFSSSVIWLLLGGFFLAAALTKTKLDEVLLRFTLHISGTNPKHILIGLMAITMFSSMFMSNTATTAMVIAAITPLLHSLGKNSGVTKALLLGVPIAAAIGGMGTIIGSPTNAIAAGAMEQAGVKIDFLEWMLYGMPVAIVLTAIACAALMFLFLRKETAPVSLQFQSANAQSESPEHRINRRIVVVTLIITILLWVTGSFFNIKVATVAAVPIVVLTLTRIISAKDIQALPWDTLLLVAGGLSLGIALQNTGLSDYYADKIVAMGLQPLAYVFIIAYFGMLLSNIMSNSALATLLVPLGLVVLPSMQKEISLIIAFATSTAMFLPVSTPPNAIAFSTGMLEQKDFRIGGLLMGILGPLLIILWVKLIS